MGLPCLPRPRRRHPSLCTRIRCACCSTKPGTSTLPPTHCAGSALSHRWCCLSPRPPHSSSCTALVDTPYLCSDRPEDHNLGGSARCSPIPARLRVGQRLVRVPQHGAGGRPASPTQQLPLAASLAQPEVARQWMHLAKVTTSTLRRRGSGLQDRLKVIRAWEKSHPLPSPEAVALMAALEAAAEEGHSHGLLPAALPTQHPVQHPAQALPLSSIAVSAPAASPDAPPTAHSSTSALISQAVQHLPSTAPVLSKTGAAPSADGALADPWIRGFLMLLAGSLAQPGSPGPCLELGGQPIANTRKLLATVSNIWLQNNAPPACQVGHGDVFAQAMLLYNHFADMLPVSVWTVVWMYVSLIMQPVSQQDATERVGQALFTIADALNVPDNLATTRDLMATLSTAPANAAARHFCSTIQEGQGDAPAQPPPQAHISPLAAFNFGVQSWPTAPQLVPLPVSMPPMLMAVSMPADAGITCPPNKGMYYAGVTVWDILRNPSMPPVQRRDVALLLLQEYGHTAGQATPTMVHLPVAQQALNIQAGSEECSEACAFTAVWLAPVNVPALLAAAEAGGVHGQVPATSPVLSDYAPRIRIKGLGRALTAAWAVRAFKAGQVLA